MDGAVITLRRNWRLVRFLCGRITFKISTNFSILWLKNNNTNNYLNFIRHKLVRVISVSISNDMKFTLPESVSLKSFRPYGFVKISFTNGRAAMQTFNILMKDLQWMAPICA